jgi:hypothetical protein
VLVVAVVGAKEECLLPALTEVTSGAASSVSNDTDNGGRRSVAGRCDEKQPREPAATDPVLLAGSRGTAL